MRVLTFTGLFPNAEKPVQGIFISQRMAHFAARSENQVYVVAPVPYFPTWLRWTQWRKEGQIPQEEKIGTLTVYHPRYPLLPKISMPLHGLLMVLGTLRMVRSLHRRLKFDCIDAHFVYPDGFAAVLLGKLLKVPVVVSARGTDLNVYPSLPLIRSLIRWTLSHATGLVAVSASLREVMLELGAKPEKVRVIGNGIDANRFSPIDSGTAKKHLRLPTREKVIISVGALIQSKGFQLLIPAVANVIPRIRDLHLYILGEGMYRSKLEALIRQYGVSAQITLVGSVPNEQLRCWYSAAVLSCLASSREGMANVLLESMACGTPVLATRVGGAPEVVISPQLGLLVEQNIQAIADALELGLTSKWNREFIAQHAAQRTWAQVASEVEEFLRTSITSAKGGS